MTKREFVAIILKLLGIYALIQSLPLMRYMGFIVEGVQEVRNGLPSAILMFVLSAIPFLIMVLVGVLLLLSADKLANIIIGRDGSMDITGKLSAEDLQAIGFSVAAVLVFILAIPMLFSIAGNIIFVLGKNEPEYYMQRILLQNLWSILSVSVQMGLAVILFFRSRGLVNLWRRIQAARYVKIEEATDDESRADKQ